MSPSTLRLKPVAVMMMSASRCLAGLQQDARLREALDLVGDHRGLAGRDALEQVAVGNEGDPLTPGPVARRKVRLDVVVRAEQVAHAASSSCFTASGSSNVAAGEGRLVVEDLAAHDLVDPGLVDLQLAQGVGQVVGVAPVMK